MAHFAQIDSNNIVVNVIVVNNDCILDDNGNESEAKGIEFCQSLLGGRWVQTSYNKQVRKNFASNGFTYDIVRDAFIPPKPFLSWVLVEETCQWEAPIPKPNDGKIYDWDEETTSWLEIEPQ